MARDIIEIMNDLRRDVLRWKEELARLCQQGQHSTADSLETIIADGEKTLARWDRPA